MTELSILAEQYETDKLTHGYLKTYQRLFSFLQKEGIQLLEIGIYKGASLRMWRDFFPYGTIVGIDNEKEYLFEEDRIKTYCIDQTNIEELKQLVKLYGYFDIIIDDGGHYSSQQIISSQILLPCVRHFYIIEDLFTSYDPTYNEGGKYTCIDMLKNMIDAVMFGSIKGIDFRKGLCVIHKGWNEFNE